MLEKELSKYFHTFCNSLVDQIKLAERRNFYPCFIGDINKISQRDIAYTECNTFLIEILNENETRKKLQKLCQLLPKDSDGITKNEWVDFFSRQFNPKNQNFPAYAHSINKEIELKEYCSYPLFSIIYSFDEKSVMNIKNDEHFFNVYKKYLYRTYSDKKLYGEEKKEHVVKKITKIKQQEVDDMKISGNQKSQKSFFSFEMLEKTPNGIMCKNKTGKSIYNFFYDYSDFVDDTFHIADKETFEKNIQMGKISKELVDDYFAFYKSLDTKQLRDIVTKILVLLLFGDEFFDREDFSLSELNNYIPLESKEFAFIFNGKFIFENTKTNSEEKIALKTPLPKNIYKKSEYEIEQKLLSQFDKQISDSNFDSMFIKALKSLIKSKKKNLEGIK